MSNMNDPLAKKTESALDTQVGGNHYKNFKIQPVKFIETNDLTFLEGCIIKRICRWSRGGKGKQDLLKARHEIDLLLELRVDETL